MRLHRLRMVAFGSFPGTEEVDFDALSETGLFLIHGPTGAGKTTVLDAISFALYGSVPGVRDSARSLRCDHAPPSRGPSVTLEATIRGRRLRVTRSPSWLRPKLRGSGLVEEKGKVHLEELLPSGWVTRSTRVDEAGHFIIDLLGMNAGQFSQVAMLPQGEFARFLRADGRDRRELLERLFAVRIYTDMERWLAEHRTATGREQQELRQRVDSVLNQMRGAAGGDLPVPEEANEPADWAGALLEVAREAVATAERAREASQAALRAARDRLREAQTLADRQQRYATALARSQELDQTAEERSELAAILDAAARADRVSPLIRQATERAEAATKARKLAADAAARAQPGDERDYLNEIARVRQVLPEESRLAAVRDELEATTRQVADLAAEQARLTERLAELPDQCEDADERVAAARLAAAEIAGLTAVRDAQKRLREIDDRVVDLDEELARLVDNQVRVRAEQAELPEALSAAEQRLRTLRDQVARIPAAQVAVDTARERCAAVQARDTLTVEVAAADRDRQSAVDAAQRYRDRFLEVRQRRIDGMAAELATGLIPGEPCVVCGSPSHPAPAQPGAVTPTAEDEQAAQEAFEAAQRAREAAERHLATVTSRLDEAAARAGGLGEQDAAARLAAAEAELELPHQAAAEEPTAAAEAARLARELEAARERAGELERLVERTRAVRAGLLEEREHLATRAAQYGGDVRERLEQARALADRQDELAEQAARLTAELAELTDRDRALGEELARARAAESTLAADERRLVALIDATRGDDPSVRARLERLLEVVDLIREATDAAASAERAERERQDAVDRAEGAACEAGFASVDDAVAAVRSPADREEIAERLRHWDGERMAVDQVLAAPELVAAAAAPTPDLATLEAVVEQAEADHSAHVSAFDRARARLDELTRLAGALAGAVRRLRPARERHLLAKRLAELTNGTAADNRWHMPLSAFVLGERLRQVVDAANDRLRCMSGGRYLLRHDLNRAAGDRARSGGGLGLRVLDAWTGTERDPATLSGGESFVASLALALGLADVVTAEAGGAEIGTLFVDEGFGTLDDETLDDVLDILDGLREGGRAVGVVSHVAELRSRIPSRLKVVKGRAGSTLTRG